MNKHRIGIRSVDLDFREYRKANVVGQFAELLNLIIAAGFLATELIARKSEDSQSATLICFVQLLQLLVLRCEATLACDIDHEGDMTSKGIEIQNRAVGLFCTEFEPFGRSWIVWVGHGSSQEAAMAGASSGRSCIGRSSSMKEFGRPRSGSSCRQVILEDS